MFRSALIAAATAACCSMPALAEVALQPAIPVERAGAGISKSPAIHIVEPELRIVPSGAKSPRVAVTLDACMGKVDMRILNALVENRIAATLFVTARWLKQNDAALAVIKQHPDLFQIENHGAQHVPAITNLTTMYNIGTAGSLDGVRKEIQGGVDAIVAKGAPKPAWYRDATARYSTDAVKLAEDMGYKIAGYSLNGDMGASLLAGAVEKRISKARDGDVIISHINQPTRSAGDGVVKGLLALKAKGFNFVRLQDVETIAKMLIVEHPMSTLAAHKPRIPKANKQQAELAKPAENTKPAPIVAPPPATELPTQ